MPRPLIVIFTGLLLAALGWMAGSTTLYFAAWAIIVLTFGLGVARPQLRFFGPFVCRGNASRRCVALTFDDGPDERSTPALLDLLRERNVMAAFFCIGRRVAAHPELTARIVASGHILGNHTYSHSNATNFFSLGRLKSELDQTQAAIEKAAGTAPRIFRPPMGLSNPRVFRVARALGLTVVGWTARGLDTIKTDPERIVARIEKGLKPGAIILLHDGNIPAERLLATVSLLLQRLCALNYQVVRLDQILA